MPGVIIVNWISSTAAGLKRVKAHTRTASSSTTDCFVDGYDDGQRAQFWMSRSAMPCWCCWRPDACGLPVSSVDWQPVLPHKRRWLSDTSNATVLDRVGHWRVTVDLCRTSSNSQWQYPCVAWLVHIVGVCRMKAVHKGSALWSSCMRTTWPTQRNCACST